MTALVFGCREPIRLLGGSSAGLDRARAETAFRALGARTIDPFRAPRFDTARVRIAQAALLPSRVWNDTLVWTDMTTGRRTLGIAGALSDGRYRLNTSRNPLTPAAPAESRHLIHLSRASDSEFTWDTDVVYAIGTVRAVDVAAMVRAVLSVAEGRAESAVRADYASAVPTATAVAGQLFRLDSIQTAHLEDSSTIATYAVTLTPRGVEDRYPNFARYLQRYLQTARMQWTLTDRMGASYLDFSARDGRFILKVRTRHSAMIPMAGEARAMPDSLILHGSTLVKVRRFNAGFRDYRGEFILTHSQHASGFTVISRREPDWELPLLTESLLRTPLRRPFEGSGATFSLGVKDSAGAQTLLVRTLHLTVKESAILRFIGKLSSIALSDFSDKVEREQYQWLRELFDALVLDAQKLTS
jgi:hypothetical protein